MSATTVPFDVAALRRAEDAIAALDAALADDVEWIEIDQRTQPRSPSVVHGRATVIAGIRAAHARGLVSRVTDGFATGDPRGVHRHLHVPDRRARRLQRA